MGERCRAPDGPEKLSRYNKDEICRWCAQSQLTPADAPTEAPTTGHEEGSLAESGGTVRCASCSQEAAWGLLFLHPFAQAFAGADGVSPLCAACYYRKHESSGIVVAHARDWRLTGGSAEERFEARSALASSGGRGR